ncbi:MAG: UDP-N-acetylmuramoyl-tripeptide--D-alanyl-D-alanine ligase [Mariprofundaceae bacterium]|nr:UDP-N-acetylmuramoyl-tripeptide--D-alanyl-D-alanine ligase [Mariprofundaceae bacterium]
MSGIDIQTFTAGRWHGAVPTMLGGVSSDTRKLNKGDAFVALRGPNFDGHAFAEEAVNRGAAALIGDSAGMRAWQELDVPQLEVSDGLLALGDIAAGWRTGLDLPVLAITGSFGKTTLRSMLEHILASKGLRLTATRSNDNNLIGVPQTLLRVQPDDAAAIIECGISEPGEMQRLASMLRPDVAVITGIAAAHAEGLGSLAGVASEKALLLDAISAGGSAVLGHGVSVLLGDRALPDGVRQFDMDAEDAGVVYWEMHACRVRLRHASAHAEFDFILPARHWAADAALAATITLRLGLASLKEVADAMCSWEPVVGRMRSITGTGGCRILDDSYNANPASMQAALDTLKSLSGRRIAVLGDMAELGRDSAGLHAGLNIENLDVVLLLGAEMQHLSEKSPIASHMQDVKQAAGALRDLQLNENDTVLIKGSRCMRMELVVNALANGAQQEVGNAV